MDCEKYLISCEIAEVAEAIGQPTGWEISGVLVAGLAAIGTILIAILNLRIIRQQKAIQELNQLRESKSTRARYGLMLVELEYAMRDFELKDMEYPDLVISSRVELIRLKAEAMVFSPDAIEAKVRELVSSAKSKEELLAATSKAEQLLAQWIETEPVIRKRKMPWSSCAARTSRQ